MMTDGHSAASTCLMVLYVSQEQDTAIKSLYSLHHWVLNNLGEQLSDSLLEAIGKVAAAGDVEVTVADETEDSLSQHETSGETLGTSTEIKEDPVSGNDTEEDFTGKNNSIEEQLDEHPLSQEVNNVKEEAVEESQVSSKKACIVKRERKENTNDNKNIHATVKKNGVKLYQCKHCQYAATRNSNLMRHVQEIHSNIRYKCTMCVKSFQDKHEAKIHEQHAHGHKLKCDKCEKEFTSRGGLFNHCKKVHEKKCKYECQECNTGFLYKQHYEGHMNRHKMKKPFSCIKCLRPFSYKSSLNVHKKVCKGGNYYLTHNLDGSKKKIKKQKYLCDICGEELCSPKSLRTHRKSVHCAVEKLSCDKCGKMFKGKYNLKRHEKLAHNDSPLLKCSLCEQTFTQPEVLRQHVKRHNQEYLAQCSTCGKGFYSNYKLKEHERSHTGEKPFSCEICNNYKCSSKSNLDKHYKTHEERPIKQKKKKRTKVTVVNQTDQMTMPMVTHPNSSLLVDTVAAATSESDYYKHSNELHTSSHTVSHTDYLSGAQTASYHGNQPTDNNMVAMTMANDDMLQYEQQHYTLLQPSDGSYDSRLQTSGYYEEHPHSNNATQIPQNMNILTMAMDLANSEPY